MNPSQASSPATETAVSALRDPDRFLQGVATTARADFDRCLGDAAAFARKEPEKALLSALAVGYVLRILPITSIVRLFFRFVLALLKPAIFIYGGAKLWRTVQPVAPSDSSQEET